MTISILVLIVCAALFLLAFLLPYNAVRDLSFSILAPTIAFALVYSLDRGLLDFGITRALGESMATLFSSVAQHFKVPQIALFTTWGTMVIFVVFLLLWLASAITISTTTTGVAPWKKDRYRSAKRLTCGLVFLLCSTFVTTAMAGGIRPLYFVRSGFLEGLFELLYPWEVCFL